MNIFDKIKKIINSNCGYVTRKDIDIADIPSIYLSRYVKRNKLVQIVRGFYAREDWIVDQYLVFQYTYPRYIYSYNSAIYLHGLGDILPNYLEVTGPMNYRPLSKIRNDVYTHTDTREETYNLGVINIATNLGNKVKVYDIEKTICDFIRNKDAIDFEVYVKAIHSYAKRKDKDINKLMQYAKVMKIEDRVRSVMEVILNGD